MATITQYPRTAPIEPGPSCLDLFSGAGGLGVGFRQAGWSIVAGNDIDPGAGETFRLNFPEASFFEGPIRELTAQAIMDDAGIEPGELGCLVGGPPCQSFSHNNHHRNAADERARLFDYYLGLVEALNPKTLVMENVPGIRSIANGAIIREIRDRLSALGFDVHDDTLAAEEYGVPQMRRRVFIVASRVGPASELLPPPTHWSGKMVINGRTKPKRPDSATKRIVNVWQAIGDLPRLENGGGAQIATRSEQVAFSEYQRAARKGAKQLYNHICSGLTKVNLDRLVHVPQGGNWRDIPRELLPAGMRRARLTDHTKRYGRLAERGLASTLLTKCDPHWGAYIHPTQNRVISVREAARLQGFPDSFRFAGDSLMKQYVQVGNAVPVPLACAIGAAVIAHLKRHASADEVSDIAA